MEPQEENDKIKGMFDLGSPTERMDFLCSVLNQTPTEESKPDQQDAQDNDAAEQDTT